ncbi:EF-hand calcium-binding domain-containing protein [Echinococcus granulosus]|uniref:EF-hand calcium-binding domain-containing protein n=1 Tax=Echinococcus granulosus TaxID=6210 RepID=W6UTI7_ECHGR|nr:EF-hand calcium-binding domain-containing protein [Echinococcus granulosus]EUB64618.1 EF-hand calcium-binding domain-containing protein [Echinococcus granulosus]
MSTLKAKVYKPAFVAATVTITHTIDNMIDPELENIDAKIFEAFDLFDHERNKTVDSRELGTIVRSLGLCPSEADLVKLTAKLENSPPNGCINYETFLPVIGQILIDKIIGTVLKTCFIILHKPMRYYKASRMQDCKINF